MKARSLSSPFANASRCLPYWVAAGLFVAANASCATDLEEAWRAAQTHDLDYLAAQSEHQSAAAIAAQSNALWRPTVQVSGTAGRLSSNTSVHGAQFAAPGLGSADGAIFNTSINDANLGRVSLFARQPLINPERLAQSRQLSLKAQAADVEWLIASQALMLRTAERYFDVVMAQESLNVARRQMQSVEKSLGEIKLRFELGDVPATDVHEASARMEAIQAQVMAAETDLQLKISVFLDATGLAHSTLSVMPPTGAIPATGKTLDEWLSLSAQNNPNLRLMQVQASIAREEALRYSALSSASLDLVGEASHEHLSGSGDFGAASNTSRNALLGIQLTIPLYTGGYQGARHDEAAALADKALNASERTRQQVALQTRSAWMGVMVGGRRVEALAASLKSSEARLAATRLGFEVGDRTTLDLLNAENDAANARLTWMQAQVTMATDRLRLAAMAGALDENQLQSVNTMLHSTEIDVKYSTAIP